LDNRSPLAGIAFATISMPVNDLTSVHTGTLLGGPVTPSNVLSVLATARAKKGRLFLKLCKGRDEYVQNSDGTFSLTKWKALIDGYRSLNLAPYIADGTLIGHFLIDEPHRASKWGGKVIPHATVEAMAQYSKSIWPTLTTVVHTQTPWLANSPITYRYLDAGWTQYAAGKGEVTRWVTTEVGAAQSKRLGLVMGLNVLDGGNGSSGIRGPSSGKWSMSATELKTYGKVVLSHSYGCAFVMWNHNLTYYGRSDIRAAMSTLSLKATSHTKTSCQQ
jgi:hypothetical protein